MTEEQLKKKRERDAEYRRRKRAQEKENPDMQAPIDPAPETAFQVSEEQMEKYRQELQPQPVIPEEPLTPFEVLKRRMEREARR